VTSGPERERIREALLDLCFERGYARIDLPILLGRADVDEEAFHRAYDDLEDCFCAVYVGIRDDLFDRIGRAVADETSWRDRVRAAAYAFLAFLREDERVTWLGVVEVRRAGERAQRLLVEASDILLDLIDEGRAQRPDRDSITRATAEGVGARISAQIIAAVELDRLDLGEEVIPELMHAAVLPYLGAGAASEELRIRPPR
jgi:AcrR family transcriptional regulator